MKTIFLDIDGVLNSLQYDLHRGEKDGIIDITRLPLLKSLVEKTGACIVLTSSWRRHWDKDETERSSQGEAINAAFEKAGLSIYDKTPDEAVINGRVLQIKAWLKEHPEVSSFVILDDEYFGWDDLDAHVVKTNMRIGRGLEEKHIQLAEEILLQPKEILQPKKEIKWII